MPSCSLHDPDAVHVAGRQKLAPTGAGLIGNGHVRDMASHGEVKTRAIDGRHEAAEGEAGIELSFNASYSLSPLFPSLLSQ
jgi:hypothetical protein